MGGSWTRQARLFWRHDGDDDQDGDNCGGRQKTGQMDVGQSMMLTRPNRPRNSPGSESHHGRPRLKPWMHDGGILTVYLSSVAHTAHGLTLVLLLH